MGNTLLIMVLAAGCAGAAVVASMWIRTARRRANLRRSKAHHPAGTSRAYEEGCMEAEDSSDDVVGPGHELYDMMMLTLEGNMVSAARGDDGKVRITSVRPVD